MCGVGGAVGRSKQPLPLAPADPPVVGGQAGSCEPRGQRAGARVAREGCDGDVEARTGRQGWAVDVRRRYHGIAGGGHILASSNSIHPAVDPRNYRAMAEAARRFGQYPLDEAMVAEYRTKNYIARYGR